MTKAIVDIAKPLGNAVHDHIIVCRSGHASLKEMPLTQLTPAFTIY
jgi:DNA repair protein RadC